MKPMLLFRKFLQAPVRWTVVAPHHLNEEGFTCMIEHTRLTNTEHRLSFGYTIQYVEGKTRKGIKFEGTVVLEVKTDGALHFQNRLTEEEIEGIVPLFHETVIVPNTTNEIDITVFSEEEMKQAFRGSSIKQRSHLN